MWITEILKQRWLRKVSIIIQIQLFFIVFRANITNFTIYYNHLFNGNKCEYRLVKHNGMSNFHVSFQIVFSTCRVFAIRTTERRFFGTISRHVTRPGFLIAVSLKTLRTFQNYKKNGLCSDSFTLNILYELFCRT